MKLVTHLLVILIGKLTVSLLLVLLLREGIRMDRYLGGESGSIHVLKLKDRVFRVGGVKFALCEVLR